jgi:hypothetical protein
VQALWQKSSSNGARSDFLHIFMQEIIFQLTREYMKNRIRALF